MNKLIVECFNKLVYSVQDSLFASDFNGELWSTSAKTYASIISLRLLITVPNLDYVCFDSSLLSLSELLVPLGISWI